MGYHPPFACDVDRLLHCWISPIIYYDVRGEFPKLENRISLDSTTLSNASWSSEAAAEGVGRRLVGWLGHIFSKCKEGVITI